MLKLRATPAFSDALVFVMAHEKISEAQATAPEAALDLSLMERVKNRDTDAFERLIETHQARVIGTVAKMLGDDTDAEDIAQQVFIRVWNSAPRYQPTAKFTTWLFTITRNLVFNELRRRKRHPVVPLESDKNEPRFDTADPGAKSPAIEALDQEMQVAIQRAIDSLPETQRLAIVLRRYDDMTYEDIAEVLKLSVPAVKSILFRARVSLRELLKKYLEE